MQTPQQACSELTSGCQVCLGKEELAGSHRQDLEVRVGWRAQGGVHAAQGRAVEGEAHVEQRGAAVIFGGPLHRERHPSECAWDSGLLSSLGDPCRAQHAACQYLARRVCKLLWCSQFWR